MKNKFINKKTALYISVGVILLAWLNKIIKNTSSIDTVIDMSAQQFFLSAFIGLIITLLLITLLLRLSKERFSDIGLNREKMFGQLRTGFLFGVLVFILVLFFIEPVIGILFPNASAEGMDMSKLFNNIYFYPVWIFISIFKGGFAEELWRTFTLTRFEKLFGKKGLVFALIAASLVFGVGHLYQGFGGFISNSIEGLIYALIYLRKRSALEAISAHAVYDLIGVTLGFIIYY